MPLSPDAGLGESIVSRLRALEYDIRNRIGSDTKGLTTEELEFVQILQRTVIDAMIHDPQFPWTDANVYRDGEIDSIPRIMYPSVLAQKIQVPTIHCWGQNDFTYMIKQAELARSICDDSTSKQVLHGGMHDIPKTKIEIQAVLRKIDWVMTQV